MLLQLATGGTAQAQSGYSSAGGMFGDVAKQKQEARIAKAGQQTSGVSGICCWVFIKGEMMSDSVRRLRDQLFHPDSFVAKGYKKMAWWLIPLMHKHPMIMKIVRTT